MGPSIISARRRRSKAGATAVIDAAEVVGLGSVANAKGIASLGADQAYDCRSVAMADLVTFDVIMDGVGTEIAAPRKLLQPGGTMVELASDHDHLIGSLTYILATSAFESRRICSFSNNPFAQDLAAVTKGALGGMSQLCYDRVFGTPSP